MVKCAPELSHSNADVERFHSINKRMLTKENTLMNDETLIGLRGVKAAIKDCWSVNNIPVTLDMVKAAEKSHQLSVKHLK